MAQKLGPMVLEKPERKAAVSNAGQVQSLPAVELVSVSKWQGIVETIDQRYVRNESLQTLIEVLISVRNSSSISKGRVRGRPLNHLLKDISVAIDRGSIVGLIDIGGQSRRALIRILSNMEPPTRGEIRYFGKMTAFGQIGLISYSHMSCREILERSARSLGIRRAELILAMQQLPEFSGLGSMLDMPFRRTSRAILTDLGISLLCCLDHDILIVDEINKPRAKQVITNWDRYLQEASSRGKTVILNSRNVGKFLDHCSHLLLIKEGGELLAYGPSSDIRAHHADFIEQAITAPVAPEAELPEVDGEDAEEIDE